MKRYLLIVFALCCSMVLYAQQDNYSFIKLIVFDEEDKVLLVKWGGAWEVPGTRYNQPVTLSRFIDTLAAEHGIAIQHKQLNGLFTFEYENRPVLTLMHYYTARHAAGKLVVPESCEDIGWFTIKEAAALIPYVEMNLIMAKITASPRTLWGGAIKKYSDGTVEFAEEFYELNN